MQRPLSMIAAFLGIGVFAVLLNAQNKPIDAAGGADLSLSVSAPTNTVHGQKVTYNATVKNAGPDAAIKFTLTNTVLPNMTYQPTLSSSACSAGMFGNSVNCSGTSLAAGSSVTFTLVYTFSQPCTKPGIIRYSGNVKSATPDRNSLNNGAAAKTSFTCPNAACGDGVDNDGDSATDYPTDFACSSTADTDEGDVKAQCQDGTDNDGDGKIDHNQDPGCSSGQDNAEIDTSSTGNLYVAQSVTPLRPRQLLGGTLEEAILRVTLRADGENIDVTRLRFQSVDSSASAIDSLELYASGGASPFASATLAGCGSDPVPANTFCAVMNDAQLVLSNGSQTDVMVRPRMKTDTNGATPGQLIRFRLYPEVSNGSSVSARGVTSANNLSTNDGDTIAEGEIFIGRNSPGANAEILGKKNVMTLSEYSAITNANPDVNGTMVPTGTTSFDQFKFTAAAHTNTLNGLNKTVLSGIILNVNATNVLMIGNAFTFYNKADSTSKAGCVAKDTNGNVLPSANVTGSFLVECGNLTASTVETGIDQGAQATYVLEGNVYSAMISNTQSSVLQASLQAFTAASDLPAMYGPTAQHLHWLDKDTTSTRHLWIDYPDTTVNSTRYES